MPIQVKACACGDNQWISILSYRISSLGFEEVLWCKCCGTVKRIVKPNGSNERTIDYSQPNNVVVKKPFKIDRVI